MEIMCVVARDDDKKFNTFVGQSLNKFKLKTVQIGDKPDVNGVIDRKSTPEKYVIGCDVLKDQNLLTDDILVVFIHEDTNIVDNLFIDKVKFIFNDRPDIGIVGVVGIESISEDGFWLNPENKPLGHNILGKDGTVGQGDYRQYGSVGVFDKVVAIDNSIIIVRGSLIKDGLTFDRDTLKKDNNMYGMDISIQALQMGYKVAVADILTFHNSKRNMIMSDDWNSSKILFNEKYKDLSFPITIDSFEFDESEVVDVEI